MKVLAILINNMHGLPPVPISLYVTRFDIWLTSSALCILPEKDHVNVQLSLCFEWASYFDTMPLTKQGSNATRDSVVLCSIHAMY